MKSIFCAVGSRVYTVYQNHDPDARNIYGDYVNPAEPYVYYIRYGTWVKQVNLQTMIAKMKSLKDWYMLRAEQVEFLTYLEKIDPFGSDPAGDKRADTRIREKIDYTVNHPPSNITTIPVIAV